MATSVEKIAGFHRPLYLMEGFPLEFCNDVCAKRN